MGYVFIILAFVATLISLYDKRGKVERDVVLTERSKKIVGIGWFFIVLGIISLVAGLLFFEPYRYLGIESIFMLSTLFVFLGLILIFNVKMKYIHTKSYDTDPAIYKTSPIFTLGSIGIVIIIVLLYYFFW